jgi:hypothetical protein
VAVAADEIGPLAVGAADNGFDVGTDEEEDRVEKRDCSSATFVADEPVAFGAGELELTSGEPSGANVGLGGRAIVASTDSESAPAPEGYGPTAPSCSARDGPDEPDAGSGPLKVCDALPVATSADRVPALAKI